MARTTFPKARTIPALVAALALTFLAASGASAVEPSMLSAPKVLVNRTGGITATGNVDCAAAVLAAWGSYANAPDLVFTNVSWTIDQPQGRRMISATFEDHMASPCWAKAGAPFVDPGRCTLAADGTQHPCRWDSQNYGSDGWIYGNGAFKPGAVHLAVTMDGGYYDVGQDMANLGLFEMKGWNLTAARR